MIVVSDTSPLNYLVLIGAATILPDLFHEVYVPERVVTELRAPTTPDDVRAWIATPPDWLRIRVPSRIDSQIPLHSGEVHAIALAEELRADHLLVDERDARRVAQSRGLHVIGTLGVLQAAADRKLIDFEKTCECLLKTSFRVHRRLIEALIAENSRRHSP